MANFSAPVLLYGDLFLCKNNLIDAKKKYPKAKWTTISASTESLDRIRSEATTPCFDDSKRIIVVNDLPNRKQVREFLLSGAAYMSPDIKVIVWDSNNHIKIDPQTRTINKTWADFVAGFRAIPEAKVVNNGEQLTHKDKEGGISFVQKCFDKGGKTISNDVAKLVIDIVGHDRGFLQTDIEKMCLSSPNPVTSEFVIENAYPSSKEAILYLFSNILDTGSYEKSIDMMTEFMNNGIDANVLADLMTKKARWQLAASYYWAKGMGWGSIASRLMDMGKFPSYIWHNPNVSQKKSASEPYLTPDGMINYLSKEKGIPSIYFSLKKETPKPAKKGKKGKVVADDEEEEKVVKIKRGECIPLQFQAQQVVDFVRDKIIANNFTDDPEVKKKVLARAMNIYLFTLNKLAEIRYGTNPAQDLQDMAKALTNTKI